MSFLDSKYAWFSVMSVLVQIDQRRTCISKECVYKHAKLRFPANRVEYQRYPTRSAASTVPPSAPQFVIKANISKNMCIYIRIIYHHIINSDYYILIIESNTGVSIYRYSYRMIPSILPACSRQTGSQHLGRLSPMSTCQSDRCPMNPSVMGCRKESGSKSC